MSQAKKPQNVQWSWSNYFKNNTPDTIARIAKTAKLILGFLTGGGAYATHIQELPWWVPMLTSMAIIAIDQIVEFAGHVEQVRHFQVSDDLGNTREVTVEETTPDPDANS